jgi:hypothetical protein
MRLSSAAGGIDPSMFANMSGVGGQGRSGDTPPLDERSGRRVG